MICGQCGKGTLEVARGNKLMGGGMTLNCPDCGFSHYKPHEHVLKTLDRQEREIKKMRAEQDIWEKHCQVALGSSLRTEIMHKNRKIRGLRDLIEKHASGLLELAKGGDHETLVVPV